MCCDVLFILWALKIEMEPPGPRRTRFIRGERRLLLTGHSVFDSEAQWEGTATGGVKALRPALSKALPLRETQARGGVIPFFVRV